MKRYLIPTGMLLWATTGFGFEADNRQDEVHTQLRIEEGFQDQDFRDFRKEWVELAQVDGSQSNDDASGVMNNDPTTRTYDDTQMRRQLDPNANPRGDIPVDQNWQEDDERRQEIYPEEEEGIEPRRDPLIDPQTDPQSEPIEESDPRYDPMLNSDPEQGPIDPEEERDLYQPE